ncbi:hypothetical protein [Paenibacillus harenae]|uniref:hypothetical protein n=1 Tax=Paenibacillus harenae TaxID=306543 RepID=UPI00048C6EF4|nr:hypothetical protein [Paenibacillus harenae]
MKKINLLILLIVISAILVGCVDSNDKDKRKNRTLTDLNAVNSITIQTVSGGLMTITDQKSMERFNEAIHTAKYDSAQLDIASPDYMASVEFADSEGVKFSFWLRGENDGLFIKSGQNGHYRLAGTAKAALIDLFQSEEQLIENLKINENIKQIILASSLAHGSVNPEVAVEFTDHEIIDIIVRAIHTAVQIPGILNTAIPDYDIVLASEYKEYAFHLWIDETSEQAMLMDMTDTHTGYRLTKESTAKMKKIIFEELNLKALEFKAERNANGDLVAKPIGLSQDSYTLSGGPEVELQGISYHTIHLFYGNHNAINALVAHDPSTDEVHVKWNDRLSNSGNRWNNTFMSSYNMLIPLVDDRLLFLESELTEEAGQYHLSTYNVVTGTTERLRENFWPLTNEYDYIYKTQWKADEQKLFMQSYLGNVWIFDLKTGEDDVHLLKYRVIPHSTTGAPSLFLSPTFERFVHDDESGQLTFYDNKGVPLQTIPLPQEEYVPSEKIKWNPTGTIAWMDRAEGELDRILAIDIDYLKIAPMQIDFYNPDGLPIGSIQAEGGQEGAAVEVAGWMNENVAVMKSYTVELKEPDSYGLHVKDVSYYLYDVRKKKKGDASKSMPLQAIVTSDRQWGDIDEGNIIVSHEEITYLEGK